MRNKHSHFDSAAKEFGLPRVVSGVLWLAMFALLSAGCGLEALGNRACQRMRGCALAGECTARTVRTGDGLWMCYASRDEECASSQGCKEGGRCSATETGECVREDAVEAHRCENTAVRCKGAGECKASGIGFCVAKDEASCQASTNCTERGECHFSEDGVGDGFSTCYAGDTKDCGRSLACQEDGKCGTEGRAGSGRCAPTKEAHCQQSRGCIEGGACDFLRPGRLRGGRCVFIPGSTEDCSASAGCRVRGECEMVPAYGPQDPALCEPTEERHCQESEACGTERRCTYAPRPGRMKKKALPGGSCGW